MASAEGTKEQALVRLAVDHIDSVLEGVAASTLAVANEFVIASKAAGTTTDEQRKYWQTHRLSQGRTVLFQTWEGNLDAPPAYQADAAASLSYRGKNLPTAYCNNSIYSKI